MDEKERRYLQFIADSITRIDEYRPETEVEFMSNPVLQDAMVWRLQSIADAARHHVSDELKERHPEVPWRAVYRFRNIAAHQYADVDPELVWEIVSQHLEPLRKVVDGELRGGNEG